MRAGTALCFAGLMADPTRDPLFDRITFHPDIMGGRACIRGMRIPVSVILGQVAHGAAIEEILQDFPDLEPEDIAQSLRYGAWLAEERVQPA